MVGWGLGDSSAPTFVDSIVSRLFITVIYAKGAYAYQFKGSYNGSDEWTVESYEVRAHVEGEEKIWCYDYCPAKRCSLFLRGEDGASESESPYSVKLWNSKKSKASVDGSLR